MNPAYIHRKWREKLIKLTPGQLVIQITDHCNAKCPQCSMRVTSDFKRHTLNKKEVFQMIDAAGAMGIKAVSFTGGEPFLLQDDLFAYIDRAGQNHIPFIRTGTNGFMFAGHNRPNFKDKTARLADRLAATPLGNFWISLDSFEPEIHERMRGFKGVVDGISKALPIFQDAGIYPSVNLGINRNLGGQLTQDLNPRDFNSARAYETAVYHTYSRAFSQFYEQVIELGFTIVNSCYPMSIESGCNGLEAVYQASTTADIVRYTKNEKRMVFRALGDCIGKYRDRIRIFSPQSSLNALAGENNKDIDFSSPCLGGINYFFVDSAKGDTFPCGYRGGDNLGKFWKMKGALRPVEKNCRRCDWECFRDPSELIAPVLDLLSSPLGLAKQISKNPGHYVRWGKDLRYYHCCDYFDGRKAPDYKRMAGMKKNNGLTEF
jgi:sulfatase maturation enzyme AslB (radical SAM superfamily)